MPVILTQLAYLKYRVGELALPINFTPGYRTFVNADTTLRGRGNANTTHRTRAGTLNTHRGRGDAS